MGVYIKNMEMPTSCGFCVFEQETGDGCECYVNGCLTEYQKRPDDCPIVPVPPHGDLIDRDEYRDEFMNGVYALCSDDSDNYRANAIIDLWDYAPTIIPAEEGE